MSTIDSENNSKPAPEANQSKGGTGRAKEDQAREKSLCSESCRPSLPPSVTRGGVNGQDPVGIFQANVFVDIG
jgi:hypothetical protein